MQLDDQHLIIRERGYLELLDLSLQVIRAHAGPLLLALLAGILPLALFNAWLLSGLVDTGPESGPPGWYLFWMLFFVVWETPLATAPATLFLGQTVFTERPEPGRIARSFFGSLPQLIFYQVFVRGLLMPWFVTWFILYAVWPHLNEVILLERNPFRSTAARRMSTYRRSIALHSALVGDMFLQWLGGIVLGLLLFASFWLSLWCVGSLFTGSWDWDGLVYTLYYPLALWMVVAFFTVVRFLGYLDLRIRREGWEVELMLRAEEARLTRHLA